MKKGVLFFDLFFTLITPAYQEVRSENQVLGLSTEEWEKYAEDDVLYERRASGKVMDERQIIEEITAALPGEVSDEQKEEILRLRKERMQHAYRHVDTAILNVIKKLKRKGYRMCLVSNADVIDCQGWQECLLAPYFDAAVFSCHVGMMKPSAEIYEKAMELMGCTPQDSTFIGDGGAWELYGAKRVGMKTVLSEQLRRREQIRRVKILRTTDGHVRDIQDLPGVLRKIKA